MDATFAKGIEMLERDLGLEPKFLPRLSEEDDWSFVIKAHAVVEAALSHLLATAVRDPRVLKVFQRLETSNETTGKLAFIKSMDLLTEPRRKFVKHLSELRNSLVHDVSNTSFSFDAHLAKLDKGQTAKFRTAFSWRTKPHDSAPRDDWTEQALSSPKLAIWINLVLLLAEAAKRKTYFRDLLEEDEE